MTLETIDDIPVRDVAEAFEGYDCAINQALIGPGMLGNGSLNVMMRGDGKVRNRPGLKRIAPVVSAISSANYLGNPVVRGISYYDTPDDERILVTIESRMVELTSAGDNISGTDFGIFDVTGTASLEYKAMVQLIDTMYVLSDGVLNWHLRSGGAWSTGAVAAFSDLSAMPNWSQIAAHNHRLFAMEANGYKLYASAIGAAAASANWVKTDNFRVGSGEGDPARALIANQGGYLTMLCARSAWQIDTSDASVANWTSQRVTNLTGCVAGKTAVQIGQDILFLAREGVVSLGALAAADSINPETTLSAPIQPWIDRINWTYIDKAFACRWQEFYLLALPIDSNTRPKHIFPFNVRTRRWSPPWTYALAAMADPDGTSQAFAGFTFGTQCNFGDKAETIIGDNVGRLFRVDTSALADYDQGASGGTYWKLSAVTRQFFHGALESKKQPLTAEMTTEQLGATYYDVLLLRDNATASTAQATPNTGADLLVSTQPTATTTLTRTRLSARNKDRYYQAALQFFTQSDSNPILTRLSLAAFVDAEEIANTA